MLSAAQPQPNARLMATALVAGIPLWRTALKGATSSPYSELSPARCFAISPATAFASPKTISVLSL